MTPQRKLQKVCLVIEVHLLKDTAFPTMPYKFFKHFSGADSARTRHFYCPSRKCYIGAEDCTLASVTGNDCKKVHKVLQRTKSSFSFGVDRRVQLVELLQDIGYLPPKVPLSYDCDDTTRSTAYHALPLHEDDATLTFNTDGVPLFESSKFSIWLL